MMSFFVGRYVRLNLNESKTTLTGFFIGLSDGFVIISQTPANGGPLSAIDVERVWGITEIERPKVN